MFYTRYKLANSYLHNFEFKSNKELSNRIGNFRNRESDDEDFYESDDESKASTVSVKRAAKSSSSSSGAYGLKKICEYLS